METVLQRQAPCDLGPGDPEYPASWSALPAGDSSGTFRWGGWGGFLEEVIPQPGGVGVVPTYAKAGGQMCTVSQPGGWRHWITWPQVSKSPAPGVPGYDKGPGGQLGVAGRPWHRGGHKGRLVPHPSPIVRLRPPQGTGLRSGSG